MKSSPAPENTESSSLLAAIENNSVWISETLPPNSRLRTHMMGEAFFKTANVEKSIENEEFKLKTGFFRTCTILTIVTGVLPLLATKLTGEGLRSQNLHFISSSKVRCVFPMVIVSMLPYTEFGPNDHRVDAPHFSFHTFFVTHLKKFQFQKKLHL